ncbi:MAG: hypothetical protein IKQ70_09575 [Bacteroidales bacterium]|nr:hypothetical protein [Bacteroidales bacterium]
MAHPLPYLSFPPKNLSKNIVSIIANTKYTAIKNITNGIPDSWGRVAYEHIKNTKYRINFNTVDSINTPENLANFEYLGLVITKADKMLTAAKKAGVAYTDHDDFSGMIIIKINAAISVHTAAITINLVNCFCIVIS